MSPNNFASCSERGEPQQLSETESRMSVSQRVCEKRAAYCATGFNGDISHRSDDACLSLMVHRI